MLTSPEMIAMGGGGSFALCMVSDGGVSIN